MNFAVRQESEAPRSDVFYPRERNRLNWGLGFSQNRPRMQRGEQKTIGPYPKFLWQKSFN